MDERFQKLMTILQEPARGVIDTNEEHCDEYFVEQNLWRLPINILEKGITTVIDKDEFTWIVSSLQTVQDTCREKANWLIYKALDTPLDVIDLALEYYGAKVFRNGTWGDYPELLQDLPKTN